MPILLGVIRIRLDQVIEEQYANIML